MISKKKSLYEVYRKMNVRTVTKLAENHLSATTSYAMRRIKNRAGKNWGNILGKIPTPRKTQELTDIPLRLSPLPLQRGKTIKIKSSCFLIFRPL